MSRKISIGIIIVIIGWLYWTCLPDPLFDVSYSKVLYSKERKLLSAITAEDGQWRFPLRDQVPDKFATAIITFEDKRYYKHPGLDPIAIIRAIKQNFEARKVISGGSTITMQLLRIANNNPKRSLKNKLIEAIQATRAEIRYSKEEILALYSAHAPFGGNVVGLESAAWRYFGKEKGDLTWAESAMLAVLPNAPTLIHPGKNRRALKNKRDRLLTRLWHNHHMDSLTYRLALVEPIPEKPKRLPQLANHFMYYNASDTKNSSIRYFLQKKVKDILDFHAHANRQEGIYNAAVLVLDNQSGDPLVYLGNTTGKKHENAVNMVQAERSSGSILKPFLYALAIEDALINPAELLPDIPLNINGFNPKNYNKEYTGAIPADEALARSLNVPAVGLLQKYGIEKFRRKLLRLGMTTVDKSAAHYGLSLILGGAEVKLWEITKAYTHLAQSLINYGQDDKTNLISAGTIYQLFEAMQEVHRPNKDGYWETFSSSQKLAWKTGTSYGHRDAWAIGIDPTYTIGIWVGNADGEGRPGIIGSKAAGTLLFDVLHALPRSGKPWFEKPHDNLRERLLCLNSGMAASQYCTETVAALVPKVNMRAPQCNYHQPLLLDRVTKLQVYQECTKDPVDTSWFVLPADMAYYYRQQHPEYVSLPAFSDDCKERDNRSPIAILYPKSKEKLYLPKGLNGNKTFAICKAVHRSPNATIFWHIDGNYLGKTKHFHEWKIRLGAGNHTMTLMDENGYKVSREFTILGNDLAYQSE